MVLAMFREERGSMVNRLMESYRCPFTAKLVRYRSTRFFTINISLSKTGSMDPFFVSSFSVPDRSPCKSDRSLGVEKEGGEDQYAKYGITLPLHSRRKFDCVEKMPCLF